ncbi:MAG: hypothetical protein ACJA1L_001982 [Paracoccaceae bacterium]|jgi:hypothetical protein
MAQGDAEMLGLLSDTFMTATRAAPSAPCPHASTRPATAAAPRPRAISLMQRLRAARAGFLSGLVSGAVQTAPAPRGAACG